MIQDPRLRLIVMVVVGVITITSPIWANTMFDFYLNAYSMEDRMAENILILQEQRLRLEQNCFSSELR